MKLALSESRRDLDFNMAYLTQNIDNIISVKDI